MDAATHTLALLQRAAIEAGLLAADDPPPVDGVPSDAAAAAIEALIERLPPPAAPDDASCRRHHAAHAAEYAQGERLHLRHVLFAVTPGVDVDALRAKAEACLLALRARGRDAALEDRRFAEAATAFSNCPSREQGGDLGWLQAGDCAEEFARELFGRNEVGVLPRLVTSRFGLHVVEVLQRQPGRAPAFEEVQDAVRARLLQQAYVNGVRHYLQQLEDATPA